MSKKANQPEGTIVSMDGETMPDNWHEMTSEERGAFVSRRLIERTAERFESGDPNAWQALLEWSITAHPLIPESTKTKMRAKLIDAFDGIAPLDPISPERRRAEYEDMMIYAELMNVGGGLTHAAKSVAKARGASVATIRRAYERHLKRNPMCRRLDGRRKADKNRRQAVFLR